MSTLPRNAILLGDAVARLRELPPACIDCVITSPPYYRLRDYGVAGQLGLEPTVDAWVTSLRAVCAELARVLKPSGSLWLNLGDAYSRHPRYGAPAKSLFLAPERLLVALAADGWVTRNRVVWAKTNPMPHMVADRLSGGHDAVYFLTRSQRYFFDLDAVRLPFRHDARSAAALDPDLDWRGGNPGDVWRLPRGSFGSGHFATFPTALVERPLLATCPERVCVRCGTPWSRRPGQTVVIGQRRRQPHIGLVRRYGAHWRVARTLGELAASCRCGAGTRPGVVLDPFFGTGTVGVVAAAHGRDWVGIEISPAYVKLAEQRLGRTAPLEQAA